MANDSESAVRERGGIELRDYTQKERIRLNGRHGSGLNFDGIARALTWVSMGIGLFELLAPRKVQRLVGVRGDHTGLIRLLGLREITSALYIIMQARPNNAVWSRVVGDAMDLGLLGMAFTAPKVKRDRLTAAAASVAGLTALDVLTASQLTRKRSEERSASTITRKDLTGRASAGTFQVTRSITINRPAEELYRFWHQFENLPRFMEHLKEVTVIDEWTSHWVAKAPAGLSVEWDAEIIEDRPNELIAWQSKEGADVPNSGQVRFEPAPAGRGTVVRVEIEYRPPAGEIGNVIASLFGEEPSQQVKGDLHRFKEVIETGEVIRSDATPGGYGQKTLLPGQPLSDEKYQQLKERKSA